MGRGPAALRPRPAAARRGRAHAPRLRRRRRRARRLGGRPGPRARGRSTTGCCAATRPASPSAAPRRARWRASSPPRARSSASLVEHGEHARQPGRPARRAQAAADAAARRSRPPRSPRCSTGSRPRRRSSCATARCSSSPTRCGLRAEELVNLDLASVDFDAEQLRVEGKGSKTRFVPAGEPALRAVARYLERGRPALAAARRRARAVPLEVRPAALDVRRPAPPAGVGAPRRDPGRGAPARPAALLRDPSAGGRSGSAGDPGAARTRSHLHDPGLHSGRVRAPAGGVRAQPSAGLNGGDWLWKPTSKRSSSRSSGAATRTAASEPRPRAARRRLLAAGQVRRRPDVLRPARARRGGRPHLLRADRPDQRDRALRPRARDQVRDVRDHAHQGRDHRRAARAGLGAALRARPRPRDRARPRQARAPAAPDADRRGDGARARACRVDEFQEALVKISNSTVVALDELWAVSDASGDQVSLLDTLQDPDAPDPQQLLDASELKDRLADAIAALPEREKLVIALYYYENLTLREIGEVLGVTESRISQLHTKAVLRLKCRLQGDNLQGLTLGLLPLQRGRGEERRPACPCRRQDPQRGSGRPPGEREDLAARGPAVRGRRDDPARLGGRRDDGLGRRRGREGARDVDLRVAGVVRVAGREGQPDRHPRRAVLHRRRARRAARVRVGRLRRQRRDGRRGRHAAAVAARRRSSASRAWST